MDGAHSEEVIGSAFNGGAGWVTNHCALLLKQAGGALGLVGSAIIRDEVDVASALGATELGSCGIAAGG